MTSLAKLFGSQEFSTPNDSTDNNSFQKLNQKSIQDGENLKLSRRIDISICNKYLTNNFDYGEILRTSEPKINQTSLDKPDPKTRRRSSIFLMHKSDTKTRRRSSIFLDDKNLQNVTSEISDMEPVNSFNPDDLELNISSDNIEKLFFEKMQEIKVIENELNEVKKELIRVKLIKTLQFSSDKLKIEYLIERRNNLIEMKNSSDLENAKIKYCQSRVNLNKKYLNLLRSIPPDSVNQSRFNEDFLAGLSPQYDLEITFSQLNDFKTNLVENFRSKLENSNTNENYRMCDHPEDNLNSNYASDQNTTDQSHNVSNNDILLQNLQIELQKFETEFENKLKSIYDLSISVSNNKFIEMKNVDTFNFKGINKDILLDNLNQSQLKFDKEKFLSSLKSDFDAKFSYIKEELKNCNE